MRMFESYQECHDSQCSEGWGIRKLVQSHVLVYLHLALAVAQISKLRQELGHDLLKKATSDKP